MKTPMDIMLDRVDWHPIPELPGQASPLDTLPWPTHGGVLEIGGMSLKCYRLNNGQAVFNADDLLAFFEAGMPMGSDASKVT